MPVFTLFGVSADWQTGIADRVVTAAVGLYVAAGPHCLKHGVNYEDIFCVGVCRIEQNADLVIAPRCLQRVGIAADQIVQRGRGQIICQQNGKAGKELFGAALIASASVHNANGIVIVIFAALVDYDLLAVRA